MITPANHNLVILVTGESGRQHGYEDRWDEGGSRFLYYGEGQIGDMRFIKANLALRDHVSAGKDVHLFETVRGKKGWLRYVGQMVCTGFDWTDAPDRERKMRKAILFHLVPVEAFAGKFDGEPVDAPEDRQLRRLSLDELRKRALANSADIRDASERKVSYRYRSRAVRMYVLRRANGCCEGCDTSAPFMTVADEPYLEPHHIRRLTDGGPDDPRWVIAVCPNCHRRAHYAKDRIDFNAKLGVIVARLEGVQAAVASA
jgi:5-methylcytosine-specific restriction protein A